MPNLLEGLLQNVGQAGLNAQASGGSDNAFSLQDLLESKLGGYYKGVDKAMKEAGEQHAAEAIQQGVPASEVMKGLIKMISPKGAMDRGGIEQGQQGEITGIRQPGWVSRVGQAGLQAQGINAESNPEQLLKQLLQVSQIQQLQQKSTLTPEQQISTLTKTQDMLKKLGIKAKVDVTATGVPSLSTQPELGLSELPPDQQIQAVALARKVAGVRGADRLIPSITEGLKSGKTIDRIEDELRLSGQSSEFTGALRSASQQIMAGKSSTEKQSTFDDLDDLQGDPTQQMEYLKRMAIKNSSTDQQNQVMGKERTIEFIGEIENDLTTLEKAGMPTGFFSGNYENILAKVGQVQNPEMRKVATKIANAVMQYRRSMTGVQFGMKENQEYFRIFPNINKVGAFNKASINALKGTFRGDLDKFYSLSMGKNNYNKLLGETKQTQQQEVPQIGQMFNGEKVINVRRIK